MNCKDCGRSFTQDDIHEETTRRFGSPDREGMIYEEFMLSVLKDFQVAGCNAFEISHKEGGTQLEFDLPTIQPGGEKAARQEEDQMTDSIQREVA